MTIDQRASGKWRIRQMVNRKAYCIEVDHKPTKKEANILMQEYLAEHLCERAGADSRTFSRIAEDLVARKEKAGLSPSTIRSYVIILRNLPDWWLDTPVDGINGKLLQRLVNEYGKTRSPKSVRNMYGLIKVIIASARPDFVFDTKLPAVDRKIEYEPTSDDVARILARAKGTRYEAPLTLAVLGLRRGEALAITPDDIDDFNVCTINKDIVQNKHEEYVIKQSPKTKASNRKILLPEALANLIRKQGCVFDGNPHTINETLHKFQDELGIPRFRLHMLRHFSAAYMLAQGFNMRQIEQYCGWERGSNVAQKIYTYNLDPAQAQARIVGSFSGLIKNG